MSKSAVALGSRRWMPRRNARNRHEIRLAPNPPTRGKTPTEYSGRTNCKKRVAMILVRKPARPSGRYPIGCRPKPRNWKADSLAAAKMAACHPEADDLDHVYNNWAYHAEREVAGLHETHEEEKPQFFGRREATKVVIDHKWHRHHRVKARGESLVWRSLVALLERYSRELYWHGDFRSAHNTWVKSVQVPTPVQGMP